MKLRLLLFIIVLLYSQLSYCQQCQWAQKMIGTRDDYANNIVTDNIGNVYLAGYFESTALNFNNGDSIINNKLGYSDAFIAKFDSSGLCQWAKNISGSNYDYANSLAVDSSGNIYVAGSFKSNDLNFNDGISLTNSNTGSFDGYIAKYNTNGTCQWAQKIGGTESDEVWNVSVDRFGDIYVAGDFRSSLLSLNNGKSLTNTNPAFYNVFFAEYDPGGTCQWAQKISGTNSDEVYGLALDEAGDIFIAGCSQSPVLNFSDDISLNNIYSDSSFNGYLAKYSQPTSVPERNIDNNSDIVISPNPASDYIYLNLGQDMIQRGDVEIYSVYGTKVNTPPSPLFVEGEKCRIDVSGLAPGVYFVIVGAGSKPALGSQTTKREKFVVIR